MADQPNLAIQAEPVEGPASRGPVLGRTGLKHWAGYTFEEFRPELRGIRGYRIFEEMRLNEPTVGSLLAAIESIICSSEWEVHPDDDTNGADLAAASLITKAMDKLDRPFDEVMSDICTMFPFGWALLEVTYKFQEGKVWWDAMDLRGQDSLYIWKYDDRDRPITFVQRPAPTYEEIEIPLDKCLLFRTRSEKNNPEGRSILRAAYKPYFYKKVLEEVEAIGAERDLVGVPVMYAPFGSTPDEVQECQKIVARLKNDDQAGVVLTAIGPEEHQRFDLKLLTGQGGSTKVPYTNQLIQRYAAEIGLTALATFVHLGGAAAKSSSNYSLNGDVRDLFQMAVRNWMGKIADQFNRVAIPRLLAMNGMTGKCYMKHGRITQLNLQTITNFITAGVQNKLLTPDRTLEQFLRKEAELPELSDSKEAASEAEPEAPPPMLPPGAPGATGAQPGASGLNANPGANQNGIFGPQAASGKASAGGGIAPGNPASPPKGPAVQPKQASEDDDIWAEFTLKVMTELAEA